jgi:hypothetical protein
MASAAQSLPYFGRAWHIAVDTADGTHLVLSSDQFSEALRVTFSVDMVMLMAYWQAEVRIYNLSNETATRIWQGSSKNYGPKPGGLLQSRDVLLDKQPLVLGDVVTISAGYKADTSGDFDPVTSLLYYGKVLQPVWLRENVVDYKLILRLTTGLPEDAYNLTSFALEKDKTAHDSICQICRQAKTPIPFPIENIDDAARNKLSRTKFSRGQAFHGRPYEMIREIVKQHGLFAWVKPIDPKTGIGGLNVRSFDGPPPAPDHVYGPPDPYGSSAPTRGQVKRTLIGVPEQTQAGVVFRVLLDPSVRIGDVVQLAPGTVINAHPMQIFVLPAASPSVEGTYTVQGIRHIGDTRGRGDDWYTEIHAVVPNFFAEFLESKKPNG